MEPLVQMKCVACRRGAPTVTDAEIAAYKPQVPEWELIHEDGVAQLRRVFTFPTFAAALAFTNRVGQVAEEEGHHPALLTEWGKTTVRWWTHKIRGLHQNDFVMAAKTDELFREAMMSNQTGQLTLPRELGDGLLLRRATVDDADALAAFNARIHGDPESGEPNPRIHAWVHDLAARPHPTYVVGDFLLVEEQASGTIVSSLNLISQRWSYAGIPFGVGRPELVGTDPAYRTKGLVRHQMEEIHRWSAARGEMVQAITGIPYYYRQFGYEMTVELGGARIGYGPEVPQLKEGESDPYTARAATEADLPFIASLYKRANARNLLACPRDEALWQYELSGRSEMGINTWVLRVIQRAEDGEPVGYLAHQPRLWGIAMATTQYEVAPGISWHQVTPSVIRYLWQTGQGYDGQPGNAEQHKAYAFAMGTTHPVYEVLGPERAQRRWKPYAWYIRVPDLPAFLRHIAPVLNQRVAASTMSGYSGEITLNFYRGGLRLRLEAGELVEVEPWKPPYVEAGKAGFPPHTFLQLLFGYRSMEELEYAFADCWSNDSDTRLLLNILFPKAPSAVWPIS